MKYLTFLIILLSSISSVLSRDVNCEIDYTIPWSYQGCQSKSIYSATCSSMSKCLEFAANSTSKQLNVVNTYISLNTDNYEPINDCVGAVDFFPTSQNVYFETVMDYVNIQCLQQSIYLYIKLNKTVNIYFNNMNFNFEHTPLSFPDSPIGIFYEPKEYYGKAPTVYMFNMVVGNISSTYGGFLVTFNYNVYIVNTDFIDCTAAYGGAIYALGMNTTVSVIDSSFIGCFAYTSGGAIYSDSNVYSLNSTFSKNGCNYDFGGAICGIENIVIVNSTLESNYVNSGHGGAIGSAGSVTINNSLIYENRATNGGAVYGFDVSVQKSTFFNNSATNSGGAIFSSNSFNINYSNLENNTAFSNGGALVLYGGGGGSMLETKFIGNVANENGGAIYFNSPYSLSAFSLIQSDFCSNSANKGGAHYVDGICSFDLSNSRFIYNNASIDGGAIYVSNPKVSNKIIGGTFINCTSPIQTSPTFNLDLYSSYGYVYTLSGLVLPGNAIYSVPLVVDISTLPYSRAFETNPNECVHGVADIDFDGDIQSCSCFTGYSGQNCNTPNT